MLNKVFLIGNLGSDVELKYTAAGVAVGNFNLATNFVIKGEEKVEWHKIVVWDKQAESTAKFVGKGSKVHIEGRLQTRNYDDKEGVKRYVTEVVADRVTFLDSKSKGEDSDAFGG